MNRSALVVAGALLAACPGSPTRKPTTVTDVGGVGGDSEDDRRNRLIAELQDEILSLYERDEEPDVFTTMIPPEVGPARIGVGPGDVVFGDSMRLASSRWPLRLDASTPMIVRSKRLDIHLSKDAQITAAWVSDEVSWRISFCGRNAVIPLRLTALYAHDGDRWVQVVEHLSYAQIPAPARNAEGTDVLVGADIAPAVRPADMRDQLSRSLWPVLRHETTRIKDVVSVDPDGRAEADPKQPAPTLLLSPDAEGEWHGDVGCSKVDQKVECEINNAQLVDGTLKPDEARIGTIGRAPNAATIAYWVGNFTAELNPRPSIPPGKVRLRGTFIFEKRDNRWIIVQGHVSQPILDAKLAEAVFGTSLNMADVDFERGKPLSLTCEDGRKTMARESGAIVPAAAR